MVPYLVSIRIHKKSNLFSNFLLSLITHHRLTSVIITSIRNARLIHICTHITNSFLSFDLSLLKSFCTWPLEVALGWIISSTGTLMEVVAEVLVAIVVVAVAAPMMCTMNFTDPETSATTGVPCNKRITLVTVMVATPILRIRIHRRHRLAMDIMLTCCCWRLLFMLPGFLESVPTRPYFLSTCSWEDEAEE